MESATHARKRWWLWLAPILLILGALAWHLTDEGPTIPEPLCTYYVY